MEAELERVKGIEPSYAAWEAAVLPLNYTRSELRRKTQPSPSGDFSINPIGFANPLSATGKHYIGLVQDVGGVAMRDDTTRNLEWIAATRSPTLQCIRARNMGVVSAASAVDKTSALAVGPSNALNWCDIR